MPDWYLNRPEIRESLRVYLSAFWELSTERLSPRGPIPWSKIDDYRRKKGIDSELADTFEYILRELDEAYLKGL